MGGLGLLKPLIPEQIEDFSFLGGQALDVFMEIAPLFDGLWLREPVGLVLNKAATLATNIVGLVMSGVPLGSKMVPGQVDE